MKNFFYKITTYCLMLCFSFLLADIAKANDEREMIVVGHGTNEEEAKQQAYRNAIQSLIGTMVVSNVILENDQIIENKVLTHSDGYITKAKQFKETKRLENGLLEVTMIVTVKSKLLKEKLQAENITVIDVESGLFIYELAKEKDKINNSLAEQQTKEEASQNAAEIIAELLKPLPSSVLTATADIRSSEIKPQGDGMVELLLPVQVSVDMDAYRSLTQELNSTLSQLGFSGDTLQMDLWRTEILGKFPVSILGIIQNSGAFYPSIIVNEIINTSAKKTRWRNYKIDERIIEEINKLINPTGFDLEIDLRDINGNSIANINENLRDIFVQDRYHQSHSSSADDWFYGSIVTTPSAVNDWTYTNSFKSIVILPQSIYMVDGYGFGEVYYKISLTDFMLKLKLQLTEDELKSITSVTCTIKNILIPQQKHIRQYLY